MEGPLSVRYSIVISQKRFSAGTGSTNCSSTHRCSTVVLGLCLLLSMTARTSTTGSTVIGFCYILSAHACNGIVARWICLLLLVSLVALVHKVLLPKQGHVALLFFFLLLLKPMTSGGSSFLVCLVAHTVVYCRVLDVCCFGGGATRRRQTYL